MSGSWAQAACAGAGRRGGERWLSSGEQHKRRAWALARASYGRTALGGGPGERALVRGTRGAGAQDPGGSRQGGSARLARREAARLRRCGAHGGRLRVGPGAERGGGAEQSAAQARWGGCGAALGAGVGARRSVCGQRVRGGIEQA
jgi:hypothetical protein